MLSDLERVWVAHLHVLDVTERRLVHGVDVLLRDEDWRTFRDEQVSRARFLLSEVGSIAQQKHCASVSTIVSNVHRRNTQVGN